MSSLATSDHHDAYAAANEAALVQRIKDLERALALSEQIAAHRNVTIGELGQEVQRLNAVLAGAPAKDAGDDNGQVGN